MHSREIGAVVGGMSSNSRESLLSDGLGVLVELVRFVHSGKAFEEGGQRGGKAIIGSEQGGKAKGELGRRALNREVASSLVGRTPKSISSGGRKLVYLQDGKV